MLPPVVKTESPYFHLPLSQQPTSTALRALGFWEVSFGGLLEPLFIILTKWAAPIGPSPSGPVAAPALFWPGQKRSSALPVAQCVFGSSNFFHTPKRKPHPRCPERGFFTHFPAFCVFSSSNLFHRFGSEPFAPGAKAGKSVAPFPCWWI